MSTSTKPTVHRQGDLPAKLRARTVEVVAEKGLSGFSLREVARRAGVSHAAPKNYFENSSALLTAVACEGYVLLAAEFEAAAGVVESGFEKLSTIGTTYLRFIGTNPGHVAVMNRSDRLQVSDPELISRRMELHCVIRSAMANVDREQRAGLDVDHAASLFWAAMVGLTIQDLGGTNGLSQPMEPLIGCLISLIIS